MAFPSLDDLLPRPVPHRHRHRPAEGQRQRHRRPALRDQDDIRRDAGLLDLLHGDQPRRVHRAAGLRLPRTAASTGTSGSPRRASAWCSASSSTCWAASTSATPGLHPGAGGLAGGGAQRCGATRVIWGVVVLGGCSLAFGVGAYTGALPITAKQIADGAGYMLLVIVRRVLRLAVLRAATGRRRSASGSTSSACSSSRRRCSGRCSSRPARR